MKILFIVCLFISLFLYYATTHEVIRWQDKGIRLYNEQVVSKTTQGKPLQPWLTDNPYWIAFKLWVELSNNIIALLICALSGIKILTRKKGSG